MLNLYLLRHAKSSRTGIFAGDFDRPLSGRGRRAASLMAKHMAAHGLSPELVLCSPARRARETLDAMSKDLPKDAQILFEDALYGGTADAYLTLVRAHGESAGAALLIGHNPAIEDLADLLVGYGEEAARGPSATATAEKFPTAALAHIAFDIADWSKLTPGSGHLVSFIEPSDLQRDLRH
jgi:phosphohistidine phosphatase